MTFPKNIYCIGIGGIGLSALAQLFAHNGAMVSGSDRSASPVTDLLAEKGITVHFSQTGECVTSAIDLVVYSDAVPADNAERVRAQELGIPQISYFEGLALASKGKRTIAVAGTHGKTTTTAMITKMLVDIGASPTAIIGSLTKDFESNCIVGTSDIFVVEACEYRRHFLYLSPEVLVITNIEFDHTDYFKDVPDLLNAFSEMAHKESVKCVIANLGQETVRVAAAGTQAVCDYTEEESPTLSMLGEFNRMNARAAKAAVKAILGDTDEEKLDASLRSFAGTWRRFEYKGTTETGAAVYDDYAHHPTAIRETIEAVRAKFPGKHIVVAFQPHLFSRTRDLFGSFVEELAKADRILLAPIYPAREVDTGDISSDILAKEISLLNPHVLSCASFEEIEKELREHTSSDDLIITMGAGELYTIADSLTAKNNA